jgi:DNA-binding response OmpR family regulator
MIVLLLFCKNQTIWKTGEPMAQRLLVIEDEPTLARLLSYNLTQEGYEVTVEDHGTAGYDRATREPFDLIVLDLMLPGMNGIDILDKLRGQGIRTPIIVLTAKNAEEDVVRGLLYFGGFLDLLRKHQQKRLYLLQPLF